MLQLLAIERAIILNLHHLNGSTYLIREHLPRHDVGVVFHPRQHDGIALADVIPAPRLRYQVDGVRRPGRPDDLAGFRSTDVMLHHGTCIFKRIGGLLRQRVHTAVHIGMVMHQVFPLRFDDRNGLLGRCRVVEVDQRLSVHLPVQDGKLKPKRRCIQGLAHASSLG